MRVVTANVRHFASYTALDFDFRDQGLTLVHGATGSGKSTLCDIVPWGLFGKTSKGGAVDDVLAWPGDQVTEVEVVLEHMTVIRRRGPANKHNDLYYIVNGEQNRGKDITDTQKRINSILGLDIDLYLAGAYFHEFSNTAQFFTTTAKNRREICEQLVDLSLPTKLKDKITADSRIVKTDLATVEKRIIKLEGQVELHTLIIENVSKKQEIWAAEHKARIKAAQAKLENHEADHQKKYLELTNKLLKLNPVPDESLKAQIEELTTNLPEPELPCTECGGQKHSSARELALAKIRELKEKRQSNRLIEQEQDFLLDKIHALSDSMKPLTEALETVMKEKCPYALDDKDVVALAKATDDLETAKTREIAFITKQADLETLSEVASELRSILIKNTIIDVETKTNTLLKDHFDGEINIELSIEDDKLDVVITKDGNTATFTQLSKGQRQLLKLCFGVAVMHAISNHHGITFHQVFFDEALDGLDDIFKAKAYGLLEKLSLDYESVFVVEHSSELKERFDNKLKVTLTSEGSIVA